MKSRWIGTRPILSLPVSNRSRQWWIIVGLALFFALIPLALMMGVEVIHRGSLSGAKDWAIHHPKAVMATYILYLGIYLFALGLTGFPSVSLTLTALFLFMAALVSRYKLVLIGEPLLPWDFSLQKQAVDLLPVIANAKAILKIAVIVFLSALPVVASRWLPRIRIWYWLRGIMVAAGAYAVLSLTLYPNLSGNLVERWKLPNINYEQRAHYHENGLGMGFSINMKNIIVDKPEGYSKERMASLVESLKSQEESKPVLADVTLRPNVIIIMNEAFWDPTLLPGLEFDEDPIPFLHQLQQEHTSGYMLSPQYGGGTSNVEFEVLTGLPVAFLPDGSNAYQQYIHRAIPSLATVFGDYGYKKLAIHPYHGWFWNRTAAYEWLGFDVYKSVEYFQDPEYRGYYIADDEVSRELLRQVEATEEPVFIYAVTMQNHGPYEDDRYGEEQVQIYGELDNHARRILNTYTLGVKDADASLRLLIEGLEQLDEPTVVVFFGDHLPMLGYDYYVYEKTGFVQSKFPLDWSAEEIRNMHSIPFVIWSNIGLEKEYKELIGASFLGAYLLERLGMEPSANFALVGELSRSMAGVLSNLVVTSDFDLLTGEPESVRDEWMAYRQLHYDLLFGNQYVLQLTDPDFGNRYPVAGFNEELTKLVVDRYEWVEASDSGDRALFLYGNIPSGGLKIMVNGRVVSYTPVDGGVELSVPAKVIGNKSTFTVELKLVNSRDVIVARSEVYEWSW